MKNVIGIIGIIILLSCGDADNENVISNFREKELSFLHLRFGYDKRNGWIKKPDNIIMLHETFKKIGYKKLMSEREWTEEWDWRLDVRKSPKNLIDSLQITYSNYKEAPKYYREFWQRRKKEENEATAYKVISEIKRIMNSDLENQWDEKNINDTLFNLILFEVPERELTDAEANQQLEYLIEIGLHESAYNLISGENIWYEGVKWNRKLEEVIENLKEIEDANEYSPWFQDDVK